MYVLNRFYGPVRVVLYVSKETLLCESGRASPRLEIRARNLWPCLIPPLVAGTALAGWLARFGADKEFETSQDNAVKQNNKY